MKKIHTENLPTSDVSLSHDKNKNCGWIYRFYMWRMANIPNMLFMMILAVIVGIIVGAATFLFKYLISLVSGFFLPFIKNGSVNWWLIIVPVIGILITGIFTRYLIHTNLTHGVSQLINDLKNHNYRLKKSISFTPIIGGSITLGMGGSAGAEGPIAYTGAAIGSTIGQYLGLDNRMLKILIGCGTSAGIASIFSAPIGGLMFALELLHMELSVAAILAATVACLSGYLTIFTLCGFHFDLSVLPNQECNIEHLPMIIVLGIFCGFYSIYYSHITSRLDAFYKNIRNPWLKNLTGGISVGIILMCFPAMYGEGYTVLADIINGNNDAITIGSLLSRLSSGQWNLILIAGGILLLKCWIVPATNSSGGVAGDFAPTLFAGGVAGFLFANFCNLTLGMDLPVGVFAYVGMAGVMAGAIEAPLMTFFITLEMTSTYHFALPVALCVLTSYCIMKLISSNLKNHHPIVVHKS